MRLFGLIGHPVSHSLSAEYMNQRFAELHIPASYQLFDLPDLKGLDALIGSHPSLLGFNVTSPHKTAILPHLHALTMEAAQAEAVNTVFIHRALHSTRLIGHNTDIIGLERALAESGLPLPGPALILGSGGAARAAAVVMKRLHIPYKMVSRTSHSGTILTYSMLDEACIASHPLIINATPLGMHPATAARPPIPYEGIGRAHLLFDMVYNPLETAFLKEGVIRGARVTNGLSMLRYQAAASLEWWMQNPSASG